MTATSYDIHKAVYKDGEKSLTLTSMIPQRVQFETASNCRDCGGQALEGSAFLNEKGEIIFNCSTCVKYS